MAINFAGGTDAISYAGPGWQTSGCCTLRMKTTQTTANAVPLSIWNSSSRNGFAFILNNTANKLLAHAYGVDGSSVGFSFPSTTTVNDGNEHIIALNWDTNSGGANAFYIDGNLEGSGNSAVTWTMAAGETLRLANQPSFWAAYVGDISEVAVWRRQLDAVEITGWLAKKGSPGQLMNGLIFHAPLVRPARDRYGAVMTGPTGTTVSDHGPVIYPRA